MVRKPLLLSACILASTVNSLPTVAADALARPASAIHFAATDWPCWRGPQANGVASSDQSPPLRWSNSENVLWKSAIPGRGHSSPIVVGDRVILATAEEDRDTQSLLCFDRSSGNLRWPTILTRG